MTIAVWLRKTKQDTRDRVLGWMGSCQARVVRVARIEISANRRLKCRDSEGRGRRPSRARTCWRARVGVERAEHVARASRCE